MATSQYRLVIVTNPEGITHLRLLPPRGGEIIMAGEPRSSRAGALATAKNIASSAAAQGLRIVHLRETPKKPAAMAPKREPRK